MWDKWADKDIDGAVKIASIVAPYRHPKCQAVADRRRSTNDLQLVDDAELIERLVEARRRVIDQADPSSKPTGLG